MEGAAHVIGIPRIVPQRARFHGQPHLSQVCISEIVIFFSKLYFLRIDIESAPNVQREINNEGMMIPGLYKPPSLVGLK